MPDYNWICQKCRVEHELDDLEEVSEEEPHHAYLRCSECHGENFTKTLAE